MLQKKKTQNTKHKETHTRKKKKKITDGAKFFIFISLTFRHTHCLKIKKTL